MLLALEEARCRKSGDSWKPLLGCGDDGDEDEDVGDDDDDDDNNGWVGLGIGTKKTHAHGTENGINVITQLWCKLRT